MRYYRSITLLFMLAGAITLSAQGLKLFSPEIRDAAVYPQQVVMDFMERYFGKELPSLRQTTLEHKMADDKVYFRQGTLSDISLITDSMPCSITLHDRYYEVEWMKPDSSFVTVVFPAQYDLLFGKQQEELKNSFRNAVLAAPDSISPKVVPSSLNLLEDSILMTTPDSFELKSLNDALYYNKVREDTIPVFNSSHLEYSAANLFHGLIDSVDYRMYVEQAVYGLTTISYTLSLRHWLNYCTQLGLKVFFALEEQREDGILAFVLAQSRELGFNHLLSVVIPDKFITDQNAVFKVRLTPYIPTHNVKNLYKQETGNHKKKKWL